MLIQKLTPSVRKTLLLIVLSVFSIFVIFNLTHGTNNKPVPQSQVVSNAFQTSPVRLTIPAINVNASIQKIGVTSKGEMEIPSNSVDVGWFKFGSLPGEKGSAVIAGHLDGENGGAGVFINLYKLRPGDKLYVKNDKGETTTFVVRENRIYNPGYADDVFSLNDSAHLNLVTCDGVWDGVKKSYNKRLVVFTDAIQ